MGVLFTDVSGFDGMVELKNLDIGSIAVFKKDENNMLYLVRYNDLFYQISKEDIIEAITARDVLPNENFNILTIADCWNEEQNDG